MRRTRWNGWLLAVLVDLPWSEFVVSERRQLHYPMTGFLIRRSVVHHDDCARGRSRSSSR